MPMDEHQFSETVERAERALVTGDYDLWHDAMITVLSTRASDEHWARAIRRIKSAQRAPREHGSPDVRA